MKKLLDYDPELKVAEFIHLDGTGTAVIESIQDCEDILEYNANMAHFHDKGADYWRVGSIPLSVCQMWAQECGAKAFTHEWQEYAQKKVQERDFRKLNPNNIKL